MTLVELEEKVREIYYASSKIIDSDENKKNWNQFLVYYIFPLIEEIRFSLENKNSNRLAKKIYSLYKSSPYEIANRKWNTLLAFFSNEAVSTYLFYKVKEKSQIELTQNSKYELKMYVEQSISMLVVLLSSVEKIELSYRDSMERITDSILDDVFIKNAHYSKLNQSENELFRNNLKSELFSNIDNKIRLIQESEQNVLNAKEEIESKLIDLKIKLEKEAISSELKQIKNNQATITKLSNEITKLTEILNRKKRKYITVAVFFLFPYLFIFLFLKEYFYWEIGIGLGQILLSFYIMNSLLSGMQKNIEQKQERIYMLKDINDSFSQASASPQMVINNTTNNAETINQTTHAEDLFYFNQSKESEEYNSEKMLYDLVEKAQRMLERKRIKKIEDLINDEFTDFLRDKGYLATDQTRSGISGKNPGEIDIMIRNKNGTPLTIIEAFRLSSCGPDNKVVVSHIDKLVHNYDSAGLERNFVLVYAESKSFFDLWKNYIDYVTNLNANPNFKKENLLISFYDTMNQYSKVEGVRVGRGVHRRNDRELEVFHIFIDLG
ncbi:MAG TPA: hypothetical protein PLX69_05120 [Leptospiraceae bacterium]|nr:hypothetical protein [Leptospiraceae bacterium]